MYKKKVYTCVTLVTLLAIFAGILVYISYTKKSDSTMEGTFVKAFSHDDKEYCV